MEEPVAQQALAKDAGRPGDASSAAPAADQQARYEDDLYSWVVEQVDHLRAGRLDALDLANIAEELSDVGIAEYHRLHGAVRVLLMHMLKWDQQPEMRSRSWVCTIEEQRARIEIVLRKNPGLKPRIGEACAEAYGSAVRWAAHETELVAGDFPKEQPYTWDAILHRPFALDGED